MRSLLESPGSHQADQNGPEPGTYDRVRVLAELEDILSSPVFRSADRCKEFLRYVVLNKLDGHTDRLKERIIGTDVFHRPPGYATGDDPVVRVQAGEVRRRLERYYQANPDRSELRIELPVGSYSPVFHAGSAAKASGAHTQPVTPLTYSVSPWKAYLRLVSLLAFAAVIVFAATALLKSFRPAEHPNGALEQFWGPALTSHQPILICLANASRNAAQAASDAQRQASPSASQAIGVPSSSARNEDREIVPAGDASVAFALAALFGKLDRPSQLRIGAAATYEDLRDFPGVVIGGFNNKWTMQLVSSLHFAFIRDKSDYLIREQVPGGRIWAPRLGSGGETAQDFAIVARLIDSKTGQFTVLVAGIGPRGTQAAGEFVSSSHDLEEGLANAPAHWQNRNLEIVLETTVTDAVAGPPHVLAQYAW